MRYLSLDIQADDTANFSLDNAYSFEDTFSWFIPDKLGRHDAKFGAKYTHIWVSNPVTTVSGITGGDRRNAADFLRLTGLVATSGLPRQAQLGVRLGF